MAAPHDTIISIPQWFCTTATILGGATTLGFIGTIFYLGGLHHQLKSVCKGYPMIQNSLTRISEILLQHNMANAPIYVMSHSPVQLTDDGKKALVDAKFDDFYERNKNALIQRVKEKNPETMADLELSCKIVMLSMEEGMTDFQLLKNYAYTRGEPISNILFAGAISLRDKLAPVLDIRE